MPFIEDQDKLEHLIDQYGLAGIMGMTADILGKKAEHLRENWQDEGSAKYVDKASKFFERLAVSAKLPTLW
jgi:hypothetical protein